MERPPGAVDIDVSYLGGEIAVLRLAGELDLRCEPELQEALDSICERTACALFVDLASVTFAGVGVLARLAAACRRFHTAELWSPTPGVEKALELLGFVDGSGALTR